MLHQLQDFHVLFNFEHLNDVKIRTIKPYECEPNGTDTVENVTIVAYHSVVCIYIQ